MSAVCSVFNCVLFQKLSLIKISHLGPKNVRFASVVTVECMQGTEARVLAGEAYFHIDNVIHRPGGPY